MIQIRAVAPPILLQKSGRKLPVFGPLEVLQSLVLILSGVAGSIVVLKVGEIAGFDYYEEYYEFYDPLTVAEDMGVLSAFFAAEGVRSYAYSSLITSSNTSKYSLKVFRQQPGLAMTIPSLRRPVRAKPIAMR